MYLSMLYKLFIWIDCIGKQDKFTHYGCCLVQMLLLSACHQLLRWDVGHSCSNNTFIMNLPETFKGEKLHEFRNVIASRKSFSTEI